MDNQRPPSENLPAQSQESKTELPMPSWPSNFEVDYGYAVLHIATLRLRERDRYLLLFGLLELFPKEIPKLIQSTLPTTRKLSGSKSKAERYIHTQRIVMPIREALEWYVQCLTCPLSLKIPNESVSVDVFDLSPEPAWPSMICLDDHGFIPFRAAWHDYPRLHQMISLSFSMDALVERNLLTTKQVEEIGTVVFDHLHFDIGNFPDLYGSINLIAPNPIFRQLSLRLKESSSPTGDTVVYEFTPRLGRAMDDAIMLIEEERPCGYRIHTVVLNGPSGELSLPYHIEQNRTKVIHPQYGLLYSRGPAQFVRNISIQQAYSIGKRIIRDKLRTREIPLIKEMQERVNEYSSANSEGPDTAHRLFSVTSLSATSRLHRERHRQQARNDAARLNQETFHNNATGAERAIERRMNQAREYIWFIDSYFTEDELRYAMMIGNISVTIKILTSAMVLRMNLTDSKEKDSAEPKMTHGKRLFDAFQAFQKHKHRNPMEIKVLDGQNSPVHDRFLIVDGIVHILGNSLNKLGHNYSVLLTSPNPNQILSEIESYWSKAVDLQTWVMSPGS